MLGLGSNRPHKGRSEEALLGSAAAELGKFFDEFRVSPLYRSAPLGVTDQPRFLNAAVSGFFPRRAVNASDGGKNPREQAYQLLGILADIESRHGRDRALERRWGERSLDIDILLFGEQILDGPGLCLPHPRLRERAFALRPLLDLVPGAREPGTGKPYRDILETLPPQEITAAGYLLPGQDAVYSSYRWKALP
ncbi:MAG: 2-amino-4-hydroxy-6-hydroxymethyldihydropteridine diphosphokinase [Treponema sp.]|nr:2-amino-4-hydroxy-6-hydroxymethyldihydropteridine diphosphokinase [Treponema sp.]